MNGLFFNSLYSILWCFILFMRQGTSGASLRLIGGLNNGQGRLEIYHNDKWGTICDDYFGMVDAHVACRHRGFSEATRILTADSYTKGTGQIWLDNIECSGNESALDDCSHSGWGEHNCDHSKDVGIACQGGEGTHRLSKGTLYSGLLQIYHNGVLGTVCDDHFTITDANVVCALFKWGRAKRIVTDGSLGKGSGQIWLDDVACSGMENSVVRCCHRGWGVHNCQHSQDVAVECARVRLVGGSNDNEGRVEIHNRGEWGTVCDDSFTETDGNVVCRELGYSSAHSIVTDDRYGLASGLIWLDDVECMGSESSLGDCRALPWGDNNCGHSEDVGVICVSDNAVRLVGGSSDHEGRLEIYHNGEWGTVCDDSFDVTDGNVVCKQLGFGFALIADHNSRLESGSGSIWLDNVACTGTESSLASCSHSGWGVHNCAHAQDVGIVCVQDNLIRLVGGSVAYEGRLEIKHNDVWGTVCDDYFSLTDGHVACRQLGFGLASRIVTDNSFGSSEDCAAIWLDNVACTGTESFLANCTHRGWGVENCYHSDDVSIVCVEHVDTIAPVIINCPSDQIITYELGERGAAVSWSEPNATDVSGNAILISRSHQSGQIFTYGSTIVRYVFEDATGNDAVCTFVVTVNEGDTAQPLITDCPSDQTYTYLLGHQGVEVSWFEPRATDASGPATLISRSHESGQIFTAGATTISYIFADATGNEAVCTFVVRVSLDKTTLAISGVTTASLLVFAFGVIVIVYLLKKRQQSVSNGIELVIVSKFNLPAPVMKSK